MWYFGLLNRRCKLNATVTLSLSKGKQAKQKEHARPAQQSTCLRQSSVM